MKKLFLCLAVLSLPLAACTPAVTSTAPATYANTTSADEFTATTAELAYKSWRIAATTLAQTGLIKGPTAGRVAKLDNQLYAALVIVEKAYAGANATSIGDAVGKFNSVLTSAYAEIGGK